MLTETAKRTVASAPMVTQIYLTYHTLQQAAAHGIDVPAQIAAK